MRDPELLRRAKDMRTNPTPAESRLWYHLRAKRFENCKFRHQTVIGRYIVDFTSRTARLAIEVDGDTHASQEAYDATRTRFLETQGLHVLRFTNSEVTTNLEGVLQTISQAIRHSLSPQAEKGKTETPPKAATISLSPLAGRGPGRGA